MLAASRTFWTAGKSRPIRMAMMATTTSSSIKVKARRGRRRSVRTTESPAMRVKNQQGEGHVKLSGLSLIVQARSGKNSKFLVFFLAAPLRAFGGANLPLAIPAGRARDHAEIELL